MFDYQNPAPALKRSGCFSEALTQVQHGNDLAAQVDDALHVGRSIRHRGDLRHPHDFVQGGDGNAIRLAANLKAYDLCLMDHDGVYRPPTAAWRAAFRGASAPSPGRSEKVSMEPSRSPDIFDICSAEAASSVEPEVELCTSSRLRSIAFTTACAPDACSSTAELISCVISVRRLVAFAICEEPTDCSFVAAPISCENLYTSVTTLEILCSAAPRSFPRLSPSSTIRVLRSMFSTAWRASR